MRLLTDKKQPHIDEMIESMKDTYTTMVALGYDKEGKLIAHYSPGVTNAEVLWLLESVKIDLLK